MPMYGVNPLRRLRDWLRSGKTGGGAAAPLRAVMTRGEVPCALYTTAAATQRMFCRRRHYFGDVAPTEVRVVAVGYACPNVQAEATVGNAYTVRAALELSTGQVARFKWGGADDGLVPDGSLGLVSDALTPADFGLSAFPTGAVAWIRWEVQAAVGGKFPVVSFSAASPGVTGEGNVVDDGTSASQLMATGAVSATGGWTANTSRHGPAAIVGRTATPQVSVLLAGTSIMQGANDTSGDGVNGAGGFGRRGIAAVSGRTVVWGSIAHYGSTVQAMVGDRKRDLFRYYTHVICDHGTNDLAASGSNARTAAQADADLASVIAYARSLGIIRWDQTPTLPRVTSTDSYASDAGMTPVAGFEVGGKRDAYNALIAGRAGSSINALLDDVRVAVESTTKPGVWKSTGSANAFTNDGIHPRGGTFAHAAMAPAITAAVSAYTAPAGG